MQKKLVQDRIEQMQLVEHAIEDTVNVIRKNEQVDWSQMLDLIHLTGMEKSLKTQYRDASNISARIRLHHEFSTNPQGWFPWVYEQCEIADGQLILEVGCGNGALWTENRDKLPASLAITLSDVSSGMLRDARRSIGAADSRFSFRSFDCHEIPYPDESFDLVIANHVLFYCQEPGRVFSEVRRVLKKAAAFFAVPMADGICVKSAHLCRNLTAASYSLRKSCMSGLGWKTVPTCSPRIFQTSPAGITKILSSWIAPSL